MGQPEIAIQGQDKRPLEHVGFSHLLLFDVNCPPLIRSTA